MQRDFGRSLNMFAMALNGATYKEIAAEFGVSGGRCQQLIRWTVHILLNPKRLLDDEVPDHEWWDKKTRATHKDFWFRQIEKARSAHNQRGNES